MFPDDIQPSPEPQELAGPAGSASAQAGTRYQQALRPWLEGVTGMALGPQSWERAVLKSGLPCLLQDALMRAGRKTEESGRSKFSPLPPRDTQAVYSELSLPAIIVSLVCSRGQGSNPWSGGLGPDEASALLSD